MGQAEALAACRADLEKAGYDVDLGLVGLGPGKMLVSASLASRTIMALKYFCWCRGSLLKASEVVVSQEFKDMVLEQVNLHAPRINPLLSCEPLDLGPKMSCKGTFVDFVSSSSSSPTVMSSDGPCSSSTNPRKRKLKK